MELAKKRKEQGNALFKAGKWARAISKYKSAADTVGYDVSRPLNPSKPAMRPEWQADPHTSAPLLQLA